MYGQPNIKFGFLAIWYQLAEIYKYFDGCQDIASQFNSKHQQTHKH
jgi:hypothetical protein